MIVARNLSALTQPGEAKDYFTTPLPGEFVCTAQLRQANAYWLAEIAHLAYRESDTIPQRADFLHRVGLDEVQFFDSAGTQAAIIDSHGNWPERATIVAFRGSSELADWVTNFTALPEPWPQGGNVHEGFMRALERVWAPVERRLDALQPRAVFVCGHSLGAALATLAAGLIATRFPVTALYTYGSPRVGDEGFAHQLEQRGFPIYRIVNEDDVVARVPVVLGMHRARHVGQALKIPPTGGLHPAHRRAAPQTLRALRARLSSLFDALTENVVPDELSAHAPINYVFGLR